MDFILNYPQICTNYLKIANSVLLHVLDGDLAAMESEPI